MIKNLELLQNCLDRLNAHYGRNVQIDKGTVWSNPTACCIHNHDIIEFGNCKIYHNRLVLCHEFAHLLLGYHSLSHGQSFERTYKEVCQVAGITYIETNKAMASFDKKKEERGYTTTILP